MEHSKLESEARALYTVRSLVGWQLLREGEDSSGATIMIVKIEKRYQPRNMYNTNTFGAEGQKRTMQNFQVLGTKLHMLRIW